MGDRPGNVPRTGRSRGITAPNAYNGPVQPASLDGSGEHGSGTTGRLKR